MNILHLKYAVEVANTGSINKAADNLYMNQPNLSRAIKELEDSIGITIFDRTTRGMVITPDGEEFLGYAKKILSQISEVEARYAKGKNDKQCFSASVPKAGYISDAFTRFTKKLDAKKAAEIYYKETSTMSTIDDVLHADYKLGILRYESCNDKYFKKLLEEKGLAYEMISEFECVLLMSRNHELAQKEEVSLSDLNGYTEIVCSDKLTQPFAEARREDAVDGEVKRIFTPERASRYDLLINNNDTFMWTSPVPKEFLEREGLVQKQCADGKKTYKDVLIYKQNYKLSRLDSIFITEVCNSKRRCF